MIHYVCRGFRSFFDWLWSWLKWLWQRIWGFTRCLCHCITWPAYQLWTIGYRSANWLRQTVLKIINSIWLKPPDCKILTFHWQKELQEYRSIMLKPAVDCPDICQAIRYHLPRTTFTETEDTAYVTAVVTIKTTRVQCDAESALERVNMRQDQRNRTILLMFHKVMGSRNVDDVSYVNYESPDVYRTFHVPFSSRSHTE